MDQGTESWLEWRRQGVGGSDVPCLMGELEYSTPYKLWLEKTGQKQTDDWGSRNIFAKGHENEAKIRAAYEFDQGFSFPPAQFENPDKPFVRASLDGWSEEHWKGCEIKFVGKEEFEAGTVKQSHWIQMQYQMLVTAAETWDYVISADQVSHKVVEIKADKDFQIRMLNKVCEFWALVESKTPPAFTDMDFVPVVNEELTALLDCIKDLKDSKKKEDKEQVAHWREQVFALVKHVRTDCGGVKITKTESRKVIKFEKEQDEAKTV